MISDSSDFLCVLQINACGDIVSEPNSEPQRPPAENGTNPTPLITPKPPSLVSQHAHSTGTSHIFTLQKLFILIILVQKLGLAIPYGSVLLRYSCICSYRSARRSVCVCICSPVMLVLCVICLAGSVKPAVKTEDVIQSVLTGAMV